ncbi:MAG: adenylate kinase [Chloroflexota bacterium]|nr:adenylate kinase [Chloroflexota bacterium]
MTPVNIILLGPPGVGKSTQAALLSKRYPLVTLSTGNILRAEVAAGTPLGLEAQAAIDSGGLVGDEVMIALVRSRMATLPAECGYILDGFPRTTAQATGLDRMLRELHRPLTAVLQPLLEREEVVRRMSSRRECRTCNAPVTVKPEAPCPACPACGGALFQRPDDTPAVILKRVAVYEEQTAPLAAYYQRAGLLAPVDARGQPADVAARLITAIELQRLQRRAEPVRRQRALGL